MHTAKLFPSSFLPMKTTREASNATVMSSTSKKAARESSTTQRAEHIAPLAARRAGVFFLCFFISATGVRSAAKAIAATVETNRESTAVNATVGTFGGIRCIASGMLRPGRANTVQCLTVLLI